MFSLQRIEGKVDTDHIHRINAGKCGELADQSLRLFGVSGLRDDRKPIAYGLAGLDAGVTGQRAQRNCTRRLVLSQRNDKTTYRHATERTRFAARWPPLLAALLFGFLGAACQRDKPQPFAPPSRQEANSVTIHSPAKLTSIATGERDVNGRPVRVSCDTCHSLRDSGPLPQRAEDLDEFHSGLKFVHGTLTCGSCHQAGQHDILRLADGRSIPMQDAMTLCAQCHGSQYRDYTRGAHGGMTGHWDLSKGPRLRNHCVDCHDPHAPRYVGMQPVFKPRDRIAPKTSGTVARGATHE